MSGVVSRLAEVRARIDAAAGGREVTLVLVTKTVPADAVRDACAAGARDFGENRAQELVAKAPNLANARWHFIGRLQRNKVRAVAPYVSLWQSVDRVELAREIARHAPGARVLVQVNVGDEPQKGGCGVAQTAWLVDECRNAGLDVQGLMAVPPAGLDPRPYFATLRRLTDDLALGTCSMGMSGDFEQAIAEGATMVRVGSAVFGPRPPESDARR